MIIPSGIDLSATARLIVSLQAKNYQRSLKSSSRTRNFRYLKKMKGETSKIKANEAIIKQSFEREGIASLFSYMQQEGFFQSPSSTKWHGNYEGGLVDHCLAVCELFKRMAVRFRLTFSSESIFIVSITHDLCKVGFYSKRSDGKGYTYNTEVAKKGHAKLSLERTKRFIKLTDLEEKMIRYHMGMYGTYEWAQSKGLPRDRGEYSLAELTSAFQDPLVKLFYFCDDMTSQFIDRTI